MNSLIKNISIKLVIFICAINSYSQEKAIEIIDSKVKTIIIQQKENMLSSNLININYPFTLKFDHLSKNIKTLKYEIKLHKINWEESNLRQIQYIEGLKYDYIKKKKISFNTNVKYVSYQISLPNRNIKIKESGNYTITIFDRNKILLRKKIILFDDIAKIKDIQAEPFNKSKQKLSFKLDISRINDININKYITLNIIKNNNLNNSLKSINPQFVKPYELHYNNIYLDGGNEFRDFDIKSTYIPTINIRKIIFDSVYNIMLNTDEKNPNSYSFKNDINGNFVINNIDISNDSDYTLVHFSLENNPLFESYDIYVCGLFNQWQLSNENKLKYIQGLYTTKIFIKQGFYNYKYIAQHKISKKIYPYLISGSFYQTENEYDIIVYYNPPSQNKYSVIGYKRIKVSFL